MGISIEGVRHAWASPATQGSNRTTEQPSRDMLRSRYLVSRDSWPAAGKAKGRRSKTAQMSPNDGRHSDAGKTYVLS